jgi:hypothetical protein
MPLGNQSVLYRSAHAWVDNRDQYRAGQHMHPPSKSALLAVVKTVAYTNVCPTPASTRK